MLNIRSHGFNRAQYLFLDMWWNMLIKFSKQIGNSFAKIIKTSEIELFLQIVTDFRCKLKILTNM